MHRIICSSKSLDVLGSWFYLIENHGKKKWILYSMEANWDLEIGRLMGKEEITVAVCELNQCVPAGSKVRRKHVQINLKKRVQCNIKKKSQRKKVQHQTTSN
jgi:hypothetical protein